MHHTRHPHINKLTGRQHGAVCNRFGVEKEGMRRHNRESPTMQKNGHWHAEEWSLAIYAQERCLALQKDHHWLCNRVVAGWHSRCESLSGTRCRVHQRRQWCSCAVLTLNACYSSIICNQHGAVYPPFACNHVGRVKTLSNTRRRIHKQAIKPTSRVHCDIKTSISRNIRVYQVS